MGADREEGAGRGRASGAAPTEFRIVSTGESLVVRPLNHDSIFEVNKDDERLVREIRGASARHRRGRWILYCNE
ncbi:MAG: hypothetical protein ACLFP4_11170 [Spirochaetales bacterium]